MKWFDKWFAKKSQEAWEDSRAQKNPAPIHVIPDDDIEMIGLRFQVMSANGGTIVQCKHQDRTKDRYNVVTHVIPDGEDVASRVGQIVSLELLRDR